MLMAEVVYPAFGSRSFLADMPKVTVNIGLGLMTRRSSAIADFWRIYTEVRQPTELMAVQLSFWKQLVDDYQEAVEEGMSQLSSAPAATKAPPEAAARSA
jgi:hypothetical protein